MAQPTIEQVRVDALRNTIAMIRGRHITGDGISSLFHSSKRVMADVMGLDLLWSIIVAMRFGSVLLNAATLREIAEIHHADGSITSLLENLPADMQRSMARYVEACFSRLAGTPQLLFRELRQRFYTAGITTDALDRASEIAEQMAVEVWRDDANLSLAYFAQAAKSFPERPSFVMDETAYPAFVELTGTWLNERFEGVLENIVTGTYLNEQEMR
jgi:hypothetical protein